MRDLFQQPAGVPRARERSNEDPRTTFRQVQQQDTIIWTSTLHHAYAQRIAADPHDMEAREWFLSKDTASGTFESWCRIFGQDPELIRGHITSSRPKETP